MTVQKTLTSIVLAGALALGTVSCVQKSTFENHGTRSNNTSTQNEQLPVSTISGRIIAVDEDSIPIYTAFGYRAGGANFEYELIRVQDREGKIKQILSPMPTGYQVGDMVDFNYRELTSMPFSKLLKLYGNHEPSGQDYALQKGKIRMDGLLIE